MRPIAERERYGGWTCHRSGEPELSAGGPSAISAFRRCCELHSLEPADFRSVERVVFARAAACPDCGGSGRYVGLNVVEGCPTCGGSGFA